MIDTEAQVRELQNEVVEASDRLQTVECENDRLRHVAEAARRLVATLPKCDDCDAPATRAYARGLERWCDRHGANVPEYPRSQPLRDTVAALDEMNDAACRDHNELRADSTRLRAALAQCLEELDRVCTSRSVGRMDPEPQTSLSMAMRIVREALKEIRG